MKFTIWQNINLNIEDWKSDLEYFYPDATEEELYNHMYDTNADYLEDERALLKIKPDGDILVLGDLGRWNGRASGYRIMENPFISDMLYSECDYCEWYCDDHNFRFIGHHHDGSNSYLYRVIKPELSEVQRENLMDKLYYGLTKRDIVRYTKSLRPYIQRVYGF